MYSHFLTANNVFCRPDCKQIKISLLQIFRRKTYIPLELGFDAD